MAINHTRYISFINAVPQKNRIDRIGTIVTSAEQFYKSRSSVTLGAAQKQTLVYCDGNENKSNENSNTHYSDYYRYLEYFVQAN